MIALYAVAYLYAFWCMYVLVMGLYRAHLDKRLHGLNKLLAYPVVLVGYAMDIVANLTIASVIFLEPPQEWLVTSRLQRHMVARYTWRKRLAEYICDRVLDAFDPSGDHC